MDEKKFQRFLELSVRTGDMFTESELRELYDDLLVELPFEMADEIVHLRAYTDKLAAGLPEGMLPKDIENIRNANLEFLQEIEDLRKDDLFLTKQLSMAIGKVEDQEDKIYEMSLALNKAEEEASDFLEEISQLKYKEKNLLYEIKDLENQIIRLEGEDKWR